MSGRVVSRRVRMLSPRDGEDGRGRRGEEGVKVEVEVAMVLWECAEGWPFC